MFDVTIWGEMDMSVRIKLVFCPFFEKLYIFG